MKGSGFPLLYIIYFKIAGLQYGGPVHAEQQVSRDRSEINKITLTLFYPPVFSFF